MALCKFCGQDRPLTKAHIVPAAFFRDTKLEKRAPLYLLSSDPAAHVKKALIGPYDPGILCRACEDRFHEFDDYAGNLLIRDRNKVFNEAGRQVVVADGVDYRKLKLFVVSVLWRASVSTLPYYRRVDLGPRAARACQMIAEGDPGKPSEFGTVLSCWVPTPGGSLPPKLNANPYTRRIDGLPVARLFLSSFVADVCTDSRALPDPFPELMIAPDRPVYVYARPLAGSKDLAAFKAGLEQHGERFGQRKP